MSSKKGFGGGLTICVYYRNQNQNQELDPWEKILENRTRNRQKIGVSSRAVPEPPEKWSQFYKRTGNRQQIWVSLRTGPGTARKLESVLEPEPNRNQNW